MSYGKHIYATCLAGHETLGNQFAVMVGYKGAGPAFGGKYGTALRRIGSTSTTAEAWLMHTVAADTLAVQVAEFNGPGPFPSIPAPANVVAAAKDCMAVDIGRQADCWQDLPAFLSSNNWEMLEP